MKNNCLSLLMLFFLILSTNVYSSEPKICFYIDENFQGESLCTTEGNAVDILPGKWNDSISSIEIPHGMVVSVFKDDNFSGKTFTFKESVESLLLMHWTNLNDEISSFKVRSAACFYELDKFYGNSFCLSGNESIDLYADGQKHHIVNPFNDGINSIKIPKDTQVTVYTDDGYGGKYFVLMSDFLADELEQLEMNKDITSIKVSQQEFFICDQFCVVKGLLSIPLGRSFGTYWLDDRIKYKNALISFSFSDQDVYSIEIFGDKFIKVVGGFVFFIHKNHPKNNFAFELNGNSDTLSFLFRFHKKYFEIQFIQSIGASSVYISPLIGSLFDFGRVDFNLKVEKISNNAPIIINKIVLSAEKNITRTERSFTEKAACWLIPIINLYNYVVQGECNQVDRFIKNVHDFFASNDDKILQISGSAKPYPKIHTNDVLGLTAHYENFSLQAEGTLTHIATDVIGGALTMPATTLACYISTKGESVSHVHQPRDLTPGCVDWTLDILTDFTLLFGDDLTQWNADNFGRVIEHIMREGNTGNTFENNEVEKRLIENVQTYLAENDARFIHMKTAFDFSQLSYADYLQQSKPETETETKPESESEPEPEPRSPLLAQELPLGRYELVLQNFQFTETVPRIRSGGEWVEKPELHFEIDVISGLTSETLTARQNILPVIDQWRRIYYQAQSRPPAAPQTTTSTAEEHQPVTVKPTDKPPSTYTATDETTIEASSSASGTSLPWHATDDTSIEAARLVSDVAQSWIRSSRDEYVYVVVRLAGQVISITMAIDINELDVGIAGSLTNPNYVLHPDSEGVIRGAGTAAIRALADHLSKKGKRFLISDVISKPSAIVKKKVGFKFINEL
ncbi:peptidase inhibitor family I36 protein [Yersinia hibernica]|uniref:peptidase inhibitor family I36 protein n=1 Tax=Yersinia hibernica TaxID=2339259 RepID=UPI003704B83C